jgi:hypothetical protein
MQIVMHQSSLVNKLTLSDYEKITIHPKAEVFSAAKAIYSKTDRSLPGQVSYPTGG